jgi:hypothetical protein
MGTRRGARFATFGRRGHFVNRRLDLEKNHLFVSCSTLEERKTLKAIFGKLLFAAIRWDAWLGWCEVHPN